MILLVGRRTGRADLLEALGDRLRRQRPDLFVAYLLTNDLHRRILHAFRASGLKRAEVYDRMRTLGFDKTPQAVRGYIEEDGPLAPRDVADLRRLNRVLELDMTEAELSETFGAVRRIRGFKRAAGRTLMAAARDSAIATDHAQIDPETGLSLADLREMVLEATIVSVRRCAEPLPLSTLGILDRHE